MSCNIVSSAPANRLPELDGLRAIAISLVLVGHHLAYAPVPWVRWFTEKGWVGVDLFFVLSGFLIGGILLDQRAAANYYRVFYLRRFLRIVPLYALLVLPGLLILCTALKKHLGAHSLADEPVLAMWFCAFFAQNIGTLFQLNVPAYLGPTWSVAVEEQFYLLLPPLVRNLSQRTLLRILALAIVFAPLLRGVLILAFGDKVAVPCYVLLPCRWDSLLLGVVAAVAYRDDRFRTWVAGRLRTLQIGWWLLVIAAAGFLFGSEYHLDPSLGFLGYSVIDACFACTLLLAVMNPAGNLHRFLGLRFFKPIATVSYGLYLLQSPMLAIVESAFRFAHISGAKISWTETGIALVSLAATIVAAAVSWKFFESRMLRIGHNHRYQQ